LAGNGRWPLVVGRWRSTFFDQYRAANAVRRSSFDDHRSSIMKRKTQSTAGKGKRPALNALEDKRARLVRSIRAVPPGTVSSYGAIAKAAGWPGAARQVVRILQQQPGLPWHRVVGSGGAIKLSGEGGAEQRLRLRMEGVTFRGARVDMKRHEFHFDRVIGSSNKLKCL
jgi:methylated-DNA-protein-cysteine methyltransferase-like protein